MAKQTKVVKKRKVKVEAIGEAHIQASFNNIIISLTNKNGEVISWASAGKMGFRGSKKNTPFAAQMAAENCSQVAYEAGLRRVKVFVNLYFKWIQNMKLWVTYRVLTYINYLNNMLGN